MKFYFYSDVSTLVPTQSLDLIKGIIPETLHQYVKTEKQYPMERKRVAVVKHDDHFDDKNPHTVTTYSMPVSIENVIDGTQWYERMKDGTVVVWYRIWINVHYMEIESVDEMIRLLFEMDELNCFNKYEIDLFEQGDKHVLRIREN